jgi:PAS domain S-box-containing protein
MVLLAIRYGVYISTIGISWLGALTFLLPAFLTSSIMGYMDFMTINFNILFLSTVTLLTGRTVSDLYAEVAEHKMTEETLRLQAAALQAADNGIVITDRFGIIQWVNPAFTKLTGYTFDDALGKNPRDLIRSGKHDQAFYKNMWDAILDGQVWHGELINRRKDGTLYNEEMTLTPLKNEKGEVSRFIAIKQDITERVRADENLRYAEAKYRRLAENIPPIVYMSDLDQHIGVTYISPRINALGFTQEEWIADPERM